MCKCMKCGKDHLILHQINLGRPFQWQSKLDGCDVNMVICDDCLHSFITSFTPIGQATIFNSGARRWGTDEEWVDFMCNGREVRADECTCKRCKWYRLHCAGRLDNEWCLTFQPKEG